MILLSALALFFKYTTEPHPRIEFAHSENMFKTNDDGESFLTFPSIDDPSSVDLSVIIPAYNEEDRLPAMLDECLDYLDGRKTSYEVIIVDDGSKDKTSALGIKYTKQYGSNKVGKNKFWKDIKNPLKGLLA